MYTMPALALFCGVNQRTPPQRPSPGRIDFFVCGFLLLSVAWMEAI